jgi:hypothetical protein
MAIFGTCEECDGKGFIPDPAHPEDEIYDQTCPMCLASGWVDTGEPDDIS